MELPKVVNGFRVKEELLGVAEKVHSGGSPTATPRTILSWYNYERRGSWIVPRIKGEMNALKITTNPGFDWAYIDGLVRFVPLVESSQEKASATETEEGEVSPPETVEALPIVEESEISDPTYRIGSLKSANNPPVRVTPDSTVKEAVTKMMNYDYSQLPVMTGDRDLKGIVTWESITTQLLAGGNCELVRDCMRKNVTVIEYETPLFNAIDAITSHECVLVRNHQKVICGIVTTADLGEQFGNLSEPFLLLGEIENHIRSIIANRFTKEELQASKDPGDSDREIEGVFDLTFGEYARLIQDEERWVRLELRTVDRATFVHMLNDIRKIRNEVMHFDPDGIARGDLRKLQEFVRLLQRLRELRAQPQKVN